MKIKDKINQASVFQYRVPFWNIVLNTEMAKNHEQSEAGN